MPEWGLQSLQTVWFFVGNPPSNASSLYQAMLGSLPMSVHNSPQTNSAMAQGAADEAVFRVQVLPGRVSFFENPTPRVGANFPLYSDVEATILRFSDRAARGCDALNGAVRVGMVMNQWFVANSTSEANRTILTQIGISIPVPDPTDVIFQLNRRASIGRRSTAVNRLMKWQVESFQNIEISSIGQPQFKTLEVASLSVDINTPPEIQEPLGPEAQREILVAIAAESVRLLRVNTPGALA
jgi:hypothetical protein